MLSTALPVRLFKRLKVKNKIKLRELIHLYELDPIQLADSSCESMKFRIEIFKEFNRNGFFSARISRLETFRLQPTFPQALGSPADRHGDHELVVKDDAMSAQNISAKTSAAALEKAIKRIEAVFKLKIGRR